MQEMTKNYIRESGGWAIRESGYQSEGRQFDSRPSQMTLCPRARHFTLLASGECPCKSLWIRVSAKGLNVNVHLKSCTVKKYRCDRINYFLLLFFIIFLFFHKRGIFSRHLVLYFSLVFYPVVNLEPLEWIKKKLFWPIPWWTKIGLTEQ